MKMKRVCMLLLLLSGMSLSGCQSSTKIPQDQEELHEQTQEVIERKEITGQLINSDLYKVNVYLSDLSNSRFTSYDKENPNHDQLLDLGFWLFVYEGMDKVDYEEVDGIYYDVFSYDDFNEQLNQYLDCQLEKKGNDEWLFIDNKYYHPSLPMGYNINIVTQVDRIFDNGDGSFLIEGSIYRFDSSMEENIYEQYLQPKSTWTPSMQSELIGTLTANLVFSDRLNHYVIENYTTNYFNSTTETITPEVKEEAPIELISYLDSISSCAGEELRQLVIAIIENDYETINQLISNIKEDSIPYYTDLRGATNNQTLISAIDLYLTLLEDMARPDYEYRFILSNQYDREYLVQMIDKATQIIEMYEDVSDDSYGFGRSQVDLIYREYPFLLN
ncbi:hypothetical protein [Turicibacter sanguinis]|uniref:hypothetical protein n=1 Tax=Turicibacter sanguinis TaxID=154288 RepID=UPI0018A04D07|nr:hypothetical protein [Turicibacter sanguinis]